MDKKPLWIGLGMALELGYLIAIPIVVLAFLGRWLDKKWGTSPWLLVVGALTAATISGIAVYRKAKKYGNIIGR